MSDLKPGQYAIFDTTLGEITCELFPDKAPETVQNFVGLANGTKEFVDPQTRERTKRPFYNGLVFHRVIPKFMIQGGCPLGTGAGNPGYFINAEFNQQHHLAGTVAMARAADPNSAGSQFYICLNKLPTLDGKYTVFGQVVEGMDVVYAIGNVQTGVNDRPLENVVMNKVSIIER